MSIARDSIGGDAATLYTQERTSDLRVEALCARLRRAFERGAGGEAGVRVLERIVGMAEHDAELEPDSRYRDLESAEDMLDDHCWAYDGSMPR
jgi:hypothetical protein